MKTFDLYSDQGTKIVAQDYEMLTPDEHYGRRRVHYFEFTVGAAPAANDLYGVAKIPAGARILGGEIVTDGAGTACTLQVGVAGFDDSGYIDAAGTVADSFTFLAEDIDVEAAGADAIGSTIATNYGYKTEKALWITIRDTEVMDVATVVRGSIEIVVD